MPHLLGSGPPIRNPLSRAAYIGITANTKREDLLIASIEGIFYEAKNAISAIKKCTGVKSTDEVIVIGKMAMHKSLMEIKASILQTKIKVPKVYEAVLLGAAMLAGIGSKIYKDANEALKKVKIKYDVFNPKPSQEKQYSIRYHKIYKKIYPALQNLNKGINEL